MKDTTNLADEPLVEIIATHIFFMPANDRDCRKTARKILESIRRPTKEMINAACARDEGYMPIVDLWRTMINAELERASRD